METVWVEVKEYPNYAVSNVGEVVNLTTNLLLTPRPNDKGYLRVVLSDEGQTKDFYIHQLVAQAFMGGFTMGDRLIHINGDIQDNAINNLHPYSDIAARSTARRRPVRLSWGQPVMIRETGEKFYSVRDCADHIGGDYSSIYRVLAGSRKSHKGFTFEYI